jgi:hypothetical protein
MSSYTVVGLIILLCGAWSSFAYNSGLALFLLIGLVLVFIGSMRDNGIGD